MKLIEKLSAKWESVDHPFLIHSAGELNFDDVKNVLHEDKISLVEKGDVVAIIGDFTPSSIALLLRLIDLGTIVVPLTRETASQHEYFFSSALVNVVIDENKVTRRNVIQNNRLIEKLREQEHAGLVLFSSGTTGDPKAILHDLTLFLRRFDTPRPTLKTINFLLFDHIGGINTLFHTLFNLGTVVAPNDRSVDSVLSTCFKHNVEVLPTTPTFLRMMLLSGMIPDKFPPSIRLITYGTERMDEATLNQLVDLLPNVELRQTFGMSELGIVRVKSESSRSLFMRIGGEGIELKVVDDVLHIRSDSRMLGYLNADSPFDSDGWYNTKDIVEKKDDFYKIVGRVGDLINVGGLKFMAVEVEKVALDFPGISLINVYPRQNPITGQHVEVTVQPVNEASFDKKEFADYLKNNLQSHMVPRRITIGTVDVGHRFKKR